MTQRGKMGGVKEVPLRPVTPLAPDSLSVPPQKVFTDLRSIGRGAAADINSGIRTLAELQRYPGATQYRGGEWYEILLQEIEQDATTCFHDDEHPSDDHTWGFPVFITSYNEAAHEKLPQALENWIRAQELWLELHVLHPPFRDEAIERFKLDIVSDDSLEGASDDRIRAEFRAWMAGLGFTSKGDQSPPLLGVSMSPNPKENICLVLNEASIAMLAGLTFTGDAQSDATRFEGIKVRVVDCTWQRPAELKANETWRGIGDVSIVGLAVMFEMIISPVRGHLMTGMMHHLHPLAGMPDY
ncbi:hypothetical protein KC343_g4433 [Hortaea werneckii]|nr:hypothetical protein KC352_g10541 [Hortaea werneckii]KAI7567854.1 hypothetical protein KC317_g4698 [Hortaea werneckii]KAI7619895.1 hypothetical protein KC346_g4368 [Hortaea werneckii]KAI7630748.1 hypothetical protein KC343_g4433 [Hortaea werneckii]KAI7676911.1 hypothetical protein KC319_g4216 [Hortaea werneckii]